MLAGERFDVPLDTIEEQLGSKLGDAQTYGEINIGS